MASKAGKNLKEIVLIYYIYLCIYLTVDLFKDEKFPAHCDSILLNNNRGYHKYDKKQLEYFSMCQWKRPKEMIDNARFIVDGLSTIDVDQGYLGDCWFLSPVSAWINFSKRIPDGDKIINQVLPTGQSFDEKDYTGKQKFELSEKIEFYHIYYREILFSILGERKIPGGINR
jgi:hypothetical protein